MLKKSPQLINFFPAHAQAPINRHHKTAQRCLGPVQQRSPPTVSFKLHEPPWSFIWWSAPTCWLWSFPL